MELARKLAREMDEHRTRLGVARVRAQRVLGVALAAGPRALRGRRARGHRRALRLPARARPARGADPRLAAADHRSTPTSAWRSGNSASRRSWSARAVTVTRHEPPRARRAEPDEHGDTMIYSTSARVGGPVAGGPGAARARARAAGRRRAAPAACRRGGGVDRAQPRLRHRARRRGRLPPPRARSARARTAGRSPTSARPTACVVNGATLRGAHAAARRATASSSARPRSSSKLG